MPRACARCSTTSATRYDSQSASAIQPWARALLADVAARVVASPALHQALRAVGIMGVDPKPPRTAGSERLDGIEAAVFRQPLLEQTVGEADLERHLDTHVKYCLTRLCAKEDRLRMLELWSAAYRDQFRAGVQCPEAFKVWHLLAQDFGEGAIS
jgi:hypothetical protein